MSRRSEPRSILIGSLAAALLCGVLMALQSRMNGTLAGLLGAPVEAAWWSFGSGLVALLVAVLACGPYRRAWLGTWGAVRRGELPWWMLLSGALGGFLVGVQSGAVPALGVALFAVAVVAGQTIGGTVVDAFGLGPGKAIKVGWLRAVGALGCLMGVALAGSAATGGALPVGPTVLSVLAGLGTAFQSAWNGQINRVNGQALATTLFNFLVGSLFLLAYGLALLAAGRMRLAPLQGPWWVWWGGFCGIAFVAMGAVVVKHLGVLLFTLVALVSQLLTALVLDIVMYVPGAVSPQRVVGLAVTTAAAALAGWAAARAHRKAKAS